MNPSDLWARKLRAYRGELGGAPAAAARGADQPMVPLATKQGPGVHYAFTHPLACSYFDAVFERPSAEGPLPAQATPKAAMEAWLTTLVAKVPPHLQPVQTATPDHSEWDERRLAAALAFLEDNHNDAEHPAQAPWLLTVAVGPVGDFVEAARTGRDLWSGSYLLAHLIQEAAGVIARQWGPEAMIYPDLRGNPSFTAWLADRRNDLQLDIPNIPQGSRAALFSNKLVAVVPRGGADGWEDLSLLANRCCTAMQARWTALAGEVRAWLESVSPVDGTAWDAQVSRTFQTTWSAVPWPAYAGRLTAPRLGGAFPFQDLDPSRPTSDEQVREHDLRALISEGDWVAMEGQRGDGLERRAMAPAGNGVSADPFADRGVDYPLVYARLTATHNLRKERGDRPLPPHWDTNTCTVCLRRGQVLAAHDPRHAGSLDQRNRALKEQWEHPSLDPREEGRDKLCAVCATRRFLHEAASLRPYWLAGPGAKAQPFPSTAAVAAQAWMAQVAQNPALAAARQRVVALWSDRRTVDPSCLPQLAAAAAFDPDFAAIEAEQAFPDARSAALRRDARRRRDAGKPADAERDRARDRAWTELGERVDGPSSPPDPRVALIKIDGDKMGDLLAGRGVKATWGDVWRPDQPVPSWWPAASRNRPRAVGPALHALISRALATFAHTIVPWVVEREHAGRLIYAGGDDVLAMAPAADALRIAWRLRQLFQSLWVVDTQPLRSAWDPTSPWNPTAARSRFVAYSQETVGYLPPPPTDALPARRRFEVSSNSAIDTGVMYGGMIAVGGDFPFLEPVQVCPMLGPHHSLSAGIAVGHYKTPLRDLVEGAEGLNKYAKNELHRSAVAIGVFTRGGLKYQGGGSWRSPEAAPSQSPPLISEENFDDWWVERLRRAYTDGDLPSRLPHKLRRAFNRLCTSLSPTPTQGDRAAALPSALRRGALTEALDGEPIDPGLRGLLDALVVGEAPEQALRLLATLGAFVPEEAE